MFATSNIARAIAGTAGAALFAAACLGAAVAPAHAATAPTTRTVSYADLNLAHPAGRATLEARIKSAARSVCEAQGSDAASRVAATRCYRQAVAKATAS